MKERNRLCAAAQCMDFEEVGMSIRWLFLLLLLPLCMPLHSLAQTMGYHIGVGMGRSRSTPPEVIDMRWARQYMDTNATDAAGATRADNATAKDE